MKRFLPYILIFSVILQFFAPFSLQTNKGFDYKINTAEAADTTDFKLIITPTTTSSTISLKILLDKSSDITSQEDESVIGGSMNSLVEFEVMAYVFDSGGPGDGNKITESEPVILNASHTSSPIIIDFTGLKPSTLYVSAVLVSEVVIVQRTVVTQTGVKTIDLREDRGVVFEQVFSTPTVKDGETQTFTDIEGGAKGSGLYVDPLPECGLRNISGCIARVIYYLVFKPTSFLFALAGKVMDFTIMYSLSDSSYRSPFVSEGWQVVRDLCNMFFIFILLYVAFTTILDTGGSKNKNAVINVIIVGLLINFSLFATHLIIDASNIMARVFYNPKVMVIGPKVDGKVVGEVGKDFNEIKLSEAIVSKVDPQELLAESSTIGEVNSKSNVIKNEEEGGLTAGNFILVTLLASAVNIVGMIAFLSISLAFVGRVLGLWLAMVLSPLAFLTLTIPQLKEQKYIGWTKWWPETINIAFMAPIFVFFMYIIVMFLEKKLGLASLQNTSLTGINKVLSIIVPFILIIFLINQAKKIAIDMSGEIGQQFSKVGSSVGGFALGAMTGGTAMAMRGTVGRLGAGIMNSEKLSEAERKGGVMGFGAKQLRNIGGFAGKSSFDIRNTSTGASIDKGLGVKSGKGQAGGYIASQKKIVEEQTSRFETLKMNPAEAARQDKEAKEYNNKYEEAMYAKRSLVEKNGKRFDEKEFKEEYKKEIKDKEKETRITELQRQGKVFDQKEEDKFEKEYSKAHKYDGKTSEEVNRLRAGEYRELKKNSVFANSGTMALIDKNLKEKSKDPKAEKPISHEEAYWAKKKAARAEEKIGKINDAKEALKQEGDEITKELEEVATIIGQPGLKNNEFNKSHIIEAGNALNDKIAKKEAEIMKLNNILLQNPLNPTAINELVLANQEKRKTEFQVKGISSVLERRDKNSDKKESQLASGETQEDIFIKENKTVAQYKEQKEKSNP